MKERDGTSDVVVVVIKGNLGGFANSLETSKVNHRVDVKLAEDFAKTGTVQDVALEEMNLLASNLLDTTNSLVGGVVKIVNNNNVIILIQQFDNSVRA